MKNKIGILENVQQGRFWVFSQWYVYGNNILILYLLDYKSSK